MDDLFTKKVRAAAIAGWWTLSVVACFGLVQWLLYLLILSRRPDCVLALMGGGVTWSTVTTMWLWTIAAFKISVWLMALVVIWFTIWARLLSRDKS